MIESAGRSGRSSRRVGRGLKLVYGPFLMTTSSRIICPYCGSNEPVDQVCGTCGGLLDPASRAATAQDIGPWFLRVPQRPFFLGFTHARLHRMVRDGQLTANSIVRGPTTGGFWLPADRVPGLAQMLGCCHGCRSLVGSDDQACPRCGVPLGFEHQLSPTAVAVSDKDSGSALELIKHAQYRRIARLQNQVRLQAMALAVAAGVIFLGGVIYFTGIFTSDAIQSDPLAAADSESEAVSTDSNSAVTASESETLPAGSSPPTEVPDSMPEATNTSAELEADPVQDAASDGVAAIEDKLLEQLRDVTPAQGALITRIGELLGIAKSRDRSTLERTEAINDACSLIDDRLVDEQQELMRFRLIALRGEFERARKRLNVEAGMGR